MSAPFRCKYCGGPVNAKANGRPLPCPTLTCPCDIGIDVYAHVHRAPEPSVCGFAVKVSEHVPEDTIIITDGAPTTKAVFDKLETPMWRCKYCGDPLLCAPGKPPLPCTGLSCPSDCATDPYGHAYKIPEQNVEPLLGPARQRSVGVYAIEEVGILDSAPDPNVSKLEHAQRLLNALWDSGDMDNMHAEDCPEDDTCRCQRVQTMNLVMRGWEPPQPAGAGVPKGPYLLQPSPDLHSETAPTEVVMTGQAVGKSSAPIRSALAKLRVILVSEGDAGLCYVDPDELRAVIDMLEAEMSAQEAATDAPPRLVVCAANRRDDVDQIVVGARHYDAHMREQMERAGGLVKWRGCEQGFIDQRGVFMTREEAWKVAEASGQIRRRCGGDTASGGTLFSENLY